MFTKIQTKIIVALLVLFVFTFNITGVIAAAPLGLHMVVDTVFELPVQPAEFNASGPAVESGLMCDHGMVYEYEGEGSAHGRPDLSGILILNIDKHFVCDDNTNTFDINMKVKLDTTTGMTTAQWRISGGTGEYANLEGTGSLIGTPGVSNDVIDVYDGKVH